MARTHSADVTVHWSPDERATGRDRAHLWLFDLDDLPQQFLSDTSVLSAEEHARAGRLRTAELQRRFGVRGVLVRRVMGGLLGIEPGAVSFCSGPFGKPELAAHTKASRPLPRFNLSHSENVLALAVAVNFEVGADVECVKPDLDFLALAGTRFTSEEIQRLRAIPPGRRAVPFYRCWTRHEAAAKATGCGIAMPFSSDGQNQAWEAAFLLEGSAHSPPGLGRSNATLRSNRGGVTMTAPVRPLTGGGTHLGRLLAPVLQASSSATAAGSSAIFGPSESMDIPEARVRTSALSRGNPPNWRTQEFHAAKDGEGNQRGVVYSFECDLNGVLAIC